jgi:hypothetical protein
VVFVQVVFFEVEPDQPMTIDEARKDLDAIPRNPNAELANQDYVDEGRRLGAVTLLTRDGSSRLMVDPQDDQLLIASLVVDPQRRHRPTSNTLPGVKYGLGTFEVTARSLRRRVGRSVGMTGRIGAEIDHRRGGNGTLGGIRDRGRET